ncbi:MAG: UDP-glucose--hexose-1-phosphate uridylyltransferase, partial [Chloroflexi bacterium]|nr:UDP-glucose--hexose-1-phosphate uridylyltransferase [Chloroflexota bacterium]
RRYNPLTGEWVQVSPQRTQRPWQGQVEDRPPAQLPTYDPQCYLCPGNARAGGARNPDYAHTFVFDNDFPALLPDADPGALDVGGLLMARAERGRCRVVCFSPRHDMTLPDMALDDVGRVIDAWAQETERLGASPLLNHVQIFENNGAMMGASNPHPHSQIWATESLPNEPTKELVTQRDWHTRRGGCLLCDYLALELGPQAGARVVCQNDHFVALVPFWAVWPFETMVIGRRHTGWLPAVAQEPAERAALADILRRLTARYDHLFGVRFPYSMGFHQRPTDGHSHPEWHLHAHFYPPLLRSATVRKFMVGFELLGNPQRDITAEESAARLRALPETRPTTA